MGYGSYQCEFGSISVEPEDNIQGIEFDRFGNIIVSCGSSLQMYDMSLRQWNTWAGCLSTRDSSTGHRLQARFKEPYGIRFSRSSHHRKLMVCDWGGEYIYAIEDDQVSIFAGNGFGGSRDGPKLEAEFSGPYDIQEAAIDGLYIVCDWGNNIIRAITPEGFVVTISKEFNYPRGLTCSPAGIFYICDSGSSRIFELTLGEIIPGSTSHTVRPIAGGHRGHGTEFVPIGENACFLYPTGIIYTERGLVVCDHSNLRLRLIDLNSPYPISIIDTSDAKPEIVSNITRNCNFICLNPEGDLCWSEEDEHKIRMFPGFNLSTPLERFPTLWNIVNDPSSSILSDRSPKILTPDITWTHSKSNRVFAFHSWYLKELNSEILAPCGLSLSEKAITLLDALEAHEVEIIAKLIYGISPFNARIELSKDSHNNIISLAHISSTMKELFDDDASGLLTFFEKELNRCFNSSKIVIALFKLLPMHKPSNSRWLQAIIRYIISTCKDVVISYLKYSTSVSGVEEVLSWIQDPKALSQFQSSDYQQRYFPIVAYQRYMERISGFLVFEAFEPSSTLTFGDTSPNYVIKLNGSVRILRVHDWVLYTRWPYFKRVLESGLFETSQRLLELPSDLELSEPVLLAIMKYLYTEVLPEKAVLKEVSTFLSKHGAELEFCNLDEVPNPGFGPLFCTLDKN